jgi:hypothetical protein
MESYDENGHSRGKMRFEEELADPPRLKWEFNKKVDSNFNF